LDGGTGAYNSACFFNAKKDWAMVVLYNRGTRGVSEPFFAGRVTENIVELILGWPSIRLDVVSPEEREALDRRVSQKSDR
jgi:hypothetical protein